MGNIRHKVAAHLLVFFQRAGKLVKILRQFSQLIGAGWGHARGKIPRRQSVRTLDQSFDRGEQATRQQKRRQRGQQR
ncbi:Uncharacterised protein [Salmonella enterica subsp. enterica serovar Bovismorbificans]|nr:Uncharacterised protein [Salmonella enterica subsp. enterica serovar Bovismorbificans]